MNQSAIAADAIRDHVQIHTTGAKLIHRPVVGNLDLLSGIFPLAVDPSQSLLTYTAEPGSPRATP
jgi:MmyB-like transcription regulator ligand binding domain